MMERPHHRQYAKTRHGVAQLPRSKLFFPDWRKMLRARCFSRMTDTKWVDWRDGISPHKFTQENELNAKKKKLVSDSFAWPIWGERRINNSFCSFFVVVQKCRESFGNYVALMWAITEILCNALRVSCAVKNSKSSITLNSKLLRRFFGFLNEIDSARAVVWQRRILPEGEELFLMFYTIQDGNGRINLYIPWIPRKNCFMFPRKQGNYIVHVSECCGFFMWPNCDTIGSRSREEKNSRCCLDVFFCVYTSGIVISSYLRWIGHAYSGFADSFMIKVTFSARVFFFCLSPNTSLCNL